MGIQGEMIKKKKLIWLIISLVLAALCFSTFIFAETIILKSGEKREGKIIERTDKYIKIDFYGVPVLYYFEDIERIEGEISTKQIEGGSYNEEQIKSIIIDYYNAFDNKNLLKLKTFFSKTMLSSEEGRYFIEEAKEVFSKNMYIKTQPSIDKTNFEIKEGALRASFWQFRTYVSPIGVIATTENKVTLILKEENGDWKVEIEQQFLEKDNLTLRQADKLLAENKVDEAIAKYKEVITINPNLSSAYLGLMYAYSFNQRGDDAITAIQKAISLRADIAAYHFILGTFYRYGKNQTGRAKEEFLKARDLDPNFPGVAEQLRTLE